MFTEDNESFSDQLIEDNGKIPDTPFGITIPPPEKTTTNPTLEELQHKLIKMREKGRAGEDS